MIRVITEEGEGQNPYLETYPIVIISLVMHLRNLNNLYKTEQYFSHITVHKPKGRGVPSASN